jgi:hypothetical protein
MSQTAEVSSPENTRPSAETLQRLGPGCYVKVGNDVGLFWAEVTDSEGSKLVGKVQQTFAGADKFGIQSGQEIKFDKKLVCGTGCNKYCWC